MHVAAVAVAGVENPTSAVNHTSSHLLRRVLPLGNRCHRSRVRSHQSMRTLIHGTMTRCQACRLWKRRRHRRLPSWLRTSLLRPKSMNWSPSGVLAHGIRNGGCPRHCRRFGTQASNSACLRRCRRFGKGVSVDMQSVVQVGCSSARRRRGVGRLLC